MSTEMNKQIVRRYFEEADQDLSVLDEVVAADAVIHFPGLPEPLRGPEALKQVFGAYQKAFPDLDTKIEDLIAEGDTVVARWRATGTHKGEFQGIPPSGKHATVTGINVLRLENGKIIEDHGQFDALGLLQQIGAIKAPAG